MIGKIFGVLSIISVITAIFFGNIADVGTAVVDGAESAVRLTVSLAGITCLWSGIMRVLQSMGFIEKLSKVISPMLQILFPDTYKMKKSGEKDAILAIQAISANIGANILGIGNAATPLGINAMKKLDKAKPSVNGQGNKKNEGEASKDMIMFAVFNCASLQAIPTTLIALRTSAGSDDVFSIMIPVWICSAATSLFAVLITKFMGNIQSTVSGNLRTLSLRKSVTADNKNISVPNKINKKE